jgi:hypothetical protein
MGEAFLVAKPTGAALRALNYSPAVERLRARRGADAASLGSLLTEIGPAHGAVFVRTDCERQYGVELITQADMFAAEPAGRIIRRDSMPRPERHLVKPRQVLIAGAGTLGENELYGRAIIADSRLEGRYVGPDAMVLTFREPDSDHSLFVYAFLLTKVGFRAIRATSFGTKILRLRKDLLSDLPVPIPDKAISRKVADLVRRSVEARDEYSRELTAARRIVEAIPEMVEAGALCAERRSRAVLWGGELLTFMGWTYASHGGALAHLRRKWARRLGDSLRPDGAFYGLLRQRTPCAHGLGVPLISQRDVLAIRQLPTWIARPRVPENALFSPAGSIVMAGRGTLGEGELFARPAFMTSRLAGFALTQDLLRLVPSLGEEALVHIFLSTLVGRRLLRACAVGTKVMQLRIDLLRNIPLPELTQPAATELRRHHQAAFAALDKSAATEAEAVDIIEREVLPAWLA